MQQPDLIGREEELDQLKQYLDKAIGGEGSTVFIAGEAGIGKTRLVNELKKEALADGVNIIKGWCLAESLEPLMPVKTALREAGMQHLISGDPPPLVVSAYLMNDAGMLLNKAERTESGLDPDIFASMLQAVGNFVQDSLSMMEEGSHGALNSLGYGDFTILIRTMNTLSLATVIKGANSEFLIEDMLNVLEGLGDKFENWSGDSEGTEVIQPKISWFIESGKYDGKFLVDDPKIRQENLFDNILLGIQRSSEDSPILLFLDDLQWADPTTLNLVHYLSRNTRESKVQILGTYRPEDVLQSYDGKTHQLETVMQGMSREDLLGVVELKRLGCEETGKVVESMLGQTDFGQTFFDKVYKETDGSPFFVLEVVKLLVEDKAIGLADGSWSVVKELDEIDVPSKVYDVVKRRLNRLMKEQREILECGSVIGEEFKSEMIGGILGINKIRLLKNLSEIEKTHQLIHYLQDRYRFDHAKVKEVLYNGIGEELRKEYHKIVGDTLEELYKDDPDEALSDLAYHYLEAGDPKAEKYLINAGERARERYANEEAVRFFENATSFIEDEAKLKSIHEDLGGIYTIVGDFEEAIKNINMALDLEKERARKAEFQIKLSGIYERMGDYKKAREQCETGLDLAEGWDDLETSRLRVFLAGLYARGGDLDKALENSSKGLTFAEKSGAIHEIASAEQVIGVTYIFKGDFDRALEHLEICLENLREIEEFASYSPTLGNIGLIYSALGKLDRAMEYISESLEVAERIGDTHQISAALNNLGLVYREMGDQSGALALFERGMDISQKIGDKPGIGLRFYNIGAVYMNLDEPQKGLECHSKALAIFQEIGNTRSIVESHCDLTYAHIETGDTVKALENAEKAVALSSEMGAKGLELMGRLALGTAHTKIKDFDSAKIEFDKTQKLLDEVGEKPLQAELHYQYSVLNRGTENIESAREDLERALAMFQEMGMKLWEEKCRKALADL